jgi:hypothetical protein
LQEVERVSVLPHLVVLDLVGNPVVSATDGYRLLLLFKLRALKVLDGVAADAAELAAAQAEYAGRLTLSLLVSKVLVMRGLSSIGKRNNYISTEGHPRRGSSSICDRGCVRSLKDSTVTSAKGNSEERC